MKKVLTALSIATLLFAVGVSYDAPVKKIACAELSKSLKSYVANAETTAPTATGWNLTANGINQGDVYYSETTAVDNYRLPVLESVYIEPAEAVPLASA